MANILKSFISYPETHEFPIQNLPFGIFSTKNDAAPRAGTRIGDFVVDIKAVAQAGLFDGPLLGGKAKEVFSKPTLNDFMALGRPSWREARAKLQSLLSDSNPTLRDSAQLRSAIFVGTSDAIMHLPCDIPDYTDFYAGRNHATNVGIMFRGKDNALQPNWLHLPVGYHGRSSSVVPSGTPITRPCGQRRPDATKPPVFGPSVRLDIELEMGFFVGPGSEMGSRIDINHADEHIFGVCLLNDWSARDIQNWEYVPLGPFLAKNFGTTISPWIVSLDALSEFAVEVPAQDPEVLPYLKDISGTSGTYDIKLEVDLKPAGSSKFSTVSKGSAKYLYWSFRQMLAHHSVGGCPMRPGDLLGSGTISGETSDSCGSFLEMCWNATKPLEIPSDDGSGVIKRTFLEDGDEVNLRGYCQGQGYRIGFGDCKGVILPAKP
ncbi:Fumarylacetoacetase [Gonapodya prolifera JEL478]|uniref:Fumarylacetoacetase n=1 Tax=Gonapodya prolifera (strain JEL478) TaxID=1344416 RepID=A0A139ANM2_GONPJ|nr:Fumarylacetoacetase [Gonapodya prolifera JEL478]|eukprot:KXS18113.1 Fumarylacetoacetase [Gonapodya prolifera JEL478]